MKDSSRTTKGQFKNGTSGNPSGRPAGSRNQATLACEQLLEGNAEQLANKAVEMAMKGNINALRLCLERIIPPRKERCINLESKPIRSAQDLPLQFQDITTAITEGQITPGEGESLSNILTSYSTAMERVNLDRRIAELEEHVQEVKDCRREIEEFMRNGIPEKPAEGRKITQ